MVQEIQQDGGGGGAGGYREFRNLNAITSVWTASPISYLCIRFKCWYSWTVTQLSAVGVGAAAAYSPNWKRWR